MTDIDVGSNNKNYISNPDVNGILLYSRDQNNNMNLRFFNKSENKYIENKTSNFDIGYISSNNIVDFTTLYLKNKQNSAFLLMNDKYKIIRGNNNEIINSKLAYLKDINSTNKRIPKTCGLGCNKNDGKYCAASDSGSGNMFCKEDENCPKDKAESNLKNANITIYNYIKITDDLHFFRGNYLKSNVGGQKIIDDYYDLGKNLPASFYTLENCKNLFNLLESDVVSMTNNLVDNPNSNDILIDNTLKVKLQNYLNGVKGYYNDQNSKEKIDKLIQKLDFFSNKSNDYITKNLNSY